MFSASVFVYLFIQWETSVQMPRHLLFTIIFHCTFEIQQEVASKNKTINYKSWLMFCAIIKNNYMLKKKKWSRVLFLEIIVRGQLKKSKSQLKRNHLQPVQAYLTWWCLTWLKLELPHSSILSHSIQKTDRYFKTSFHHN